MINFLHIKLGTRCGLQNHELHQLYKHPPLAYVICRTEIIIIIIIFVFSSAGSVRFYYNNFALVSLSVQQKTLSLHLEPYKLGH